MAQKKTTTKRLARKASKALKSKTSSRTTKSLAGSTLTQSPGKPRSGKHVVSAGSASQIRRDVRATERDVKVARSTVNKVTRKGR